MKRYMLFGFDNFYPAGGLHDFIFDFESKSEFLDKIDSADLGYEWECYNVLDKEKPFVNKDGFDKKELIEFIKTNVD